jgi:hypothetical protein
VSTDHHINFSPVRPVSMQYWMPQTPTYCMTDLYFLYFHFIFFYLWISHSLLAANFICLLLKLVLIALISTLPMIMCIWVSYLYLFFIWLCLPKGRICVLFIFFLLVLSIDCSKFLLEVFFFFWMNKCLIFQNWIYCRIDKLFLSFP